VIILGLDTALGACSAALVADGTTLARVWHEMPRGHAEALAPMVRDLLTQAGVKFSELDRIAVTTGPGTFTGQRVGLAFARALALALTRPAVGVTTLDAMAEEALRKKSGAAWAIAAADAKRGEIYLGARGKGELIAPELIALSQVAARLEPIARIEGATVLVAGTAAEALLPLLTAAGLKPVDSMVRQPDAEFVARLAAGQMLSDTSPGAPPKPLYLRPPDAKLPGGVS
jgi:tRNA threonylcarbamoyladenosine biosynthesis protein TsaB